MAKQLKHAAITGDDLAEYLEAESDFAFEMQVLEALSTMPEYRYVCEHGGKYVDPATHKPRQFDIRAHTMSHLSWFYLAVECKNLKDNSPLLVSCVPRRHGEQFHEVICSFPPDVSSPAGTARVTSKVVRLTIADSPYRQGKPVGKSCVQVARDQKGEFQTTGNEIYDKWSQAMASARDLIERAATVQVNQHELRCNFVLPVVVVPDGTLWTATYSSDGRLVEKPQQSERVQYFVDHAVTFGITGRYTFSHVEFVTKSALLELAKFLPHEFGRGVYTPEIEIDELLYQG